VPGPFPPLPIKNRQDYAFKYRDAQGAPDVTGARYHGAVDWFTGGTGGDAVRSPEDGKIIDVLASRGSSGQVFGGVVRIDCGRCVYVLRHVEPMVREGEQVSRGDVVAHVTRWRDWPSGSHLHMEIWRTFAGGYRLENMMDPGEVTWDDRIGPPPPPFGGSLRLVIDPPDGGRRSWAGWDKAGPAMRWVAANGLDPRTVCALSWRGNVWRGPANVRAVATNLVRRFLDA